VTDWFRVKIDALACHASQLAEGIRYFEEGLESEAREAGARAGVALAEEFRVLDLS
jgi:LmbE family N-acetylglucosaminyl deacetylase